MEKAVYLELTECEARVLKDFLMENSTDDNKELESVYRKLKKELNEE